MEGVHVVAQNYVPLAEDIAQVRLHALHFGHVVLRGDGDPAVHHLLQPFHDLGGALGPRRVVDAETLLRLLLQKPFVRVFELPVFVECRHRPALGLVGSV